MNLAFELTTVPPQALDLLRYMGSAQLDSADAQVLMAGTGMSERSFSKAIKRLVTRNFMAMNDERVYRLTPKGHQAIEQLALQDAHGPVQSANRYQTVAYDLCVVLPESFVAGHASRAYLGIEPAGLEQVAHRAQLVLRLSADDADVSPGEVNFHISTADPHPSVQVSVTPAPGQAQIRLRVEAFQPMEFDEVWVAGGMYFDVAVGQTLPQARALHSSLAIAQPS